MFSNNYLRKIYAISYTRLLFGLTISFALVLFYSSCKNKLSTDNGEISAEFKPVNDTILKLNATKRPREAIRYLDSAYHFISAPTLADRNLYYQNHFMYSKRVLRDTKQELVYADSLMMVAEKFSNLKQYVEYIAGANFAVGDAYFDLNQYTNAYRYYYQGYLLGKNHLNNALIAEYTYRMGMVSFRQSHYKDAAVYFTKSYQESFAYTEEFRAFYQRQELLNDIGESYMRNGDLDSAQIYYNKALRYIDENSEKFKSVAYKLDIARAVIWGDQGEVLLDLGQDQQAEKLLKASIGLDLKKSYDNYNAELVEVNLAKLYVKQHQTTQLFTLLQDMHRQMDTVKNLEAQTAWNHLMSDYYIQQKDYANSFNYYKNYSELKDSLSKVDLSIKETDISQQLSNYEKQYQIQALKENNNVQRIFLYLAILAVIMAVVIILLILRNGDRSRRDIKSISALNQQINSQKNDLEETLHELKNNSQEKDRILRTVAHDLRNPIGGIMALTNVMLQDEYSDDQKELIALVNSTSKNTLELINEILEATNSKIGKSNRELVDINALVNSSVEILNFKAAEKDQKIVTELLDAPEMIFVSRERIWRVISNLISNAIKFSPNGSKISVKLVNDSREVKICVSDNGIGIPDDIKDSVFNMFTDAKRPGTAGEKSFGLGLSICQQIVENHGGKIWFESKMDKGTTFFFSLKKTSAV